MVRRQIAVHYNTGIQSDRHGFCSRVEMTLIFLFYEKILPINTTGSERIPLFVESDFAVLPKAFGARGSHAKNQVAFSRDVYGRKEVITLSFIEIFIHANKRR
jgi:hypothetical protein